MGVQRCLVSGSKRLVCNSSPLIFPSLTQTHEDPHRFPGSWESIILCTWCQILILVLSGNQMGHGTRGRVCPLTGLWAEAPCQCAGPAPPWLWCQHFLEVKRGQSLGPSSIWLGYINLPWMRSRWLRQGTLFGFPWTINREIRGLTE